MPRWAKSGGNSWVMGLGKSLSRVHVAVETLKRTIETRLQSRRLLSAVIATTASGSPTHIASSAELHMKTPLSADG